MKPRLALLLLGFGLVLAAPSGAAGAGTFGAVMGPAPLVLELAEPEVFLINTGEEPLTAVVTIEGEGFGPPETIVPRLTAGQVFSIPLTVGPGEARVEAVVTSAEPGVGMDRAEIVLELGVRHPNLWERAPWLLPLLLLLAAVAVGLFLILYRRRTAR